MLNSDILNVAIGLFVIFFVFATMCSGVTEGIQWLLRQRADYLLKGIQALLVGSPLPTTSGERPSPGPSATVTTAPPATLASSTPTVKALVARLSPSSSGAPAPGASAATRAADATTVNAVLQGNETAPLTGQDVANAIMGHPLVVGREKGGDPLDKRNAPSYLSSRSFGRAVVDLLTPPDRAGTIDDVAAAVKRLPADFAARGAFESFVSNARGSIDRFRLQVEQWYDDHMDRVSGWYSRWARCCILVIAVIVAVGFNVNPINLSRSLYTDPATRQLVVSQASSLTECPTVGGSTPSGPASAADVQQEAQCVHQQVKAVQGTELPLFWRTTAACSLPQADCSFWQRHGLSGWGWVITIVGLALGTAALAMGAPFWFDLLGRVSSLRPSGPKPPPIGDTTQLPPIPPAPIAVMAPDPAQAAASPRADPPSVAPPTG